MVGIWVASNVLLGTDSLGGDSAGEVKSVITLAGSLGTVENQWVLYITSYSPRYFWSPQLWHVGVYSERRRAGGGTGHGRHLSNTLHGTR